MPPPAGDDVVHQHVHFGGEDVDEVGLLRGNASLWRGDGRVCVRADVGHVPQVVVQIRSASWRLLNRLRAVSRRRNLLRMSPGGVQRQRAFAQNAFVVDQPRRLAGG